MTPYVIVCESATGNTVKLAQELQHHLDGQASLAVNPEMVDTESYQVYFVGSGIYNGDCSEQTIRILQALKNKNVFVYGTCGFGRSADYYETVAKRIESHVRPDNQIIGHYVCSGKLPETALSRFQKMQSANPGCRRWSESIDNYYQNASHPDQNDCSSLICAVDNALDHLCDES